MHIHVYRFSMRNKEKGTMAEAEQRMVLHKQETISLKKCGFH